MAAIDFPSSPSNGDTHTVGGVTYTYNSAETKWKTTINSNAFLPLSGGTLSGNLTLGSNQLTAGGLTYPTSDGTTGQYLQTNGSGTLSFATVTSTEYQGPAVSVQRATSTQSLTDSTWTKIQFNSENFDTDNCFDSSTNYRFTPTKAGYYAVHGQVDISYSNIEPSSQSVALYKNGSVEKRTQSSGTGLPYGARVNLNHLVYMNGSSDYLEIFAYVNRTSVIATYDENKTSFHAYWVHS